VLWQGEHTGGDYTRYSFAQVSCKFGREGLAIGSEIFRELYGKVQPAGY
jgi:hypothetical protein